MIKCIELNKEFESREEMFKALKENETKIISLKKAAVKSSEGVAFTYYTKDDTTKSIEGLEKGFIYPVINTTNYLDSHGDVHFKGIWNKSAKEQQGNIFYLVNHSLEIGKVIAYPKDVQISVKEIKWSDIGKEYEGTTEALIFKTNVFDYSNKDAANVIAQKLPAENSVRMQYVKIKLAMNSTAKGDEQNKAYYDNKINEVANKEVAEEQGYFWGIEEAKISREGSMVLLGSNDATPIIYIDEADTKSLQEIEAEKSLHDVQTLFKNIKI